MDTIFLLIFLATPSDCPYSAGDFPVLLLVVLLVELLILLVLLDLLTCFVVKLGPTNPAHMHLIFPTQMHSQTCITAEHHSVGFVQAHIAWLMHQICIM